MTEETTSLNAVVYTDGGCYQDKKIGGFGIHGYVYTDEAPKKGAGKSGWVLTPLGYQVKTPDIDAKGPITIVSYFDVVGKQDKNATNNTAELEAFIKALEMVKEKQLDVNRIHLLADSEYVLKGVNRIEMMKRSNWRKADGNPYANLEYWQRLDALLDDLKDRVEITTDWVKGHNGDPGNSRADTLATLGLSYAIAKQIPPEPLFSDAQGYWKNTVEFSRLFGAHWVVFPGGGGSAKVKDCPHGSAMYRLYNDASKQPDTRTFGTSLIGASYGLLWLKEAHEEIEMVMEKQAQVLSQNATDWDVCFVRPQTVYRPDTVKMIQQFKDAAMIPVETDLSLKSANGQALTLRFNPTRQSLQGVDHFDNLLRVMEKIHRGYVDYFVTDITDKVFDITVKPAKGKKPEETVYKLKSHPDNDDAYFDASVFGFNAEGDHEERRVRLIYGIDVPIRNTLTNAAKNNPKIEVATHVEVDGVWRYYVIVRTDEGVGIWTNPYASLLLPNPPS